MERTIVSSPVLYVTVIWTVLGNDAASSDWPQWRGPGGRAVSDDKDLPIQWDSETNMAWKTALPGPGASSPITYGKQVYVTCYSGYGLDPRASGNKEDLKRHLVCISLDDGRILWDAVVPAEGSDPPYTNAGLQEHGYATSTPAADESGVYVLLGPSGAAKFTHSGERQWLTSCGTNNHVWGSGASPVLYKDKVFISARIESDALIALNQSDGKVAWRLPGLGFYWHPPTLLNVNGSTEMFVQTSNPSIAVGLNPETGAELWRCQTTPWVTGGNVPHEDVVYSIGTTEGEAVAIRAGGRGDVTQTHLLWTLNKGDRVSSPIYYDGHLYFADGARGIVYCINAMTGDVVYGERLQPHPYEMYASPVIADGKIYYVSRKRGAYVLAAKPEYELLAHNSIETDESIFNASPAIANSKLLLRSNRFLYCIGKR